MRSQEQRWVKFSIAFVVRPKTRVQSQADVLFLKHDTHLADEKITVLLDKIRRLEVRLARVRNLEERQTQKEAQEEEETTEEEDEEEGDEDSKWGEAGHHKGGSKKNRKAEKVSKVGESSTDLHFATCVHSTAPFELCAAEEELAFWEKEKAEIHRICYSTCTARRAAGSEADGPARAAATVEWVQAAAGEWPDGSAGQRADAEAVQRAHTAATKSTAACQADDAAIVQSEAATSAEPQDPILIARAADTACRQLCFPQEGN